MISKAAYSRCHEKNGDVCLEILDSPFTHGAGHYIHCRHKVGNGIFKHPRLFERYQGS